MKFPADTHGIVFVRTCYLFSHEIPFNDIILSVS